VSLNEIIQRYQQQSSPSILEIDYLSLDVEGAESFILQSLDFDRYRIKVLTAERLKGPVRQHLKLHGFEFVQRLTKWGESLWNHESARQELNMSAVVSFGFPVSTTTVAALEDTAASSSSSTSVQSSTQP
jgi:hypothetical protein